MSAQALRSTFPGHAGDSLAATIDLPAGPPVAWALFAHCFTCGKDLRSARRLATSLTAAGFGVVRFDFTGLGRSDGEFADTDFTSNTEDLLAAVEWMRSEGRVPQVLVGHSLGGAAVLAVAGEIDEARAIVTIGAPADTAHVTKLFERSLGEIDEHGAARVVLAGREFTITGRLVDDLRRQRVLESVGRMGKALLVMHSPVDDTVGVDNAASIFEAARHPKSFVSLDRADHLLSDPVDAEYAAATIAAFATRYVTDESGVADPPDAAAQVIVAETGQGRFLNHVVVGRHHLLADEPESVGGFDAGPSPYDLLGAALGTCTSMTLRMYAERKGLPLDRVTVEVAHEKVHASDCAECAGDESLAARSGKIDRFERVIALEGGDLDDEQRASLLAVADRCPVHRTLEASSVIATRLAR